MRGVVNLSVVAEVVGDALLGPRGVLDHEDSLNVGGWVLRMVEVVKRGLTEARESLRALGDGPEKRPRAQRGILLRPEDEAEALVEEIKALVVATCTVEGRAALAMHGLLEFEDDPFAVYAARMLELGGGVELPRTVCKLALSRRAKDGSFVPVVAAIVLDAAAATLLLGLAEDYGPPPQFAGEALRRVRDGWARLVSRFAAAVTLDASFVWTKRLGFKVDGVGLPTPELGGEGLSQLAEDAVTMMLCGATLDAACQACGLVVAGHSARQITEDAVAAGSGTRALLALRFPQEPRHDESLVRTLVRLLAYAVAKEVRAQHAWRGVVYVDEEASIDLEAVQGATMAHHGMRCRLVRTRLGPERLGTGLLRCGWDKLAAYQAVALTRARRDWDYDPRFLDTMVEAMATHGLVVSSRLVRGVLADYMGKFCVILASGRCARVVYQRSNVDEVDRVVRVPQNGFGACPMGGVAWARLLGDVLPRECSFGLTGKSPEQQNRPERYCDLRGHTYETRRSPRVLLSNAHGGLDLVKGECGRALPVLRALWLLAGRCAATTERLFRVLAARLNHLDSPCFPTLVLAGSALCKTKRALFVDLFCEKVLGPSLCGRTSEPCGVRGWQGPGSARMVVFDACKHIQGVEPSVVVKTRDMERALVVVLTHEAGVPDVRPRAPDKWYVQASDDCGDEDESCSAAVAAVATDETAVWAVYKVFRAVHAVAADPDQVFHELPLASWPPAAADPDQHLLALGQAATKTFLADKREVQVLVTRALFRLLTRAARLAKTAKQTFPRTRGCGFLPDGRRTHSAGPCVDIGPALALARKRTAAANNQWPIVLSRLAKLVASPAAAVEWQ